MSKERGDSDAGAVIGLAIFIVIAILIWKYLLTPFWDNVIKNYDQVWWSGNSYQEVCNAETDTCYTLLVSESEGLPQRIDFPNGGYIWASDSACYKAASGYDFDRFCRFYDQTDNLWDIRPI